MRYKEVKIPSIKEKITVREDGKEIIYKGKSVHLILIKGKNHSKGFYMVSIESKRIYVHKLVAEAFVPNIRPLSNKMILHKDCDTINNHYKNIEWGNYEQMSNNRAQNGIFSLTALPENYRGNSKISHDEALKIAKRLEKGELASKICREYNVSDMSIARIRKRYLKQSASTKYPPEVKEVVLRLLETRQPHELVQATGLKYHTLYRWKKELSKE